MTKSTFTILQLDFDGTLLEGDASTGILAHFLHPAWTERVEAASLTMRNDPASTLLPETMLAGYEALTGDRDAYLRFVREYHPARQGLRQLVEVAERLGIECHIVSYGYDFYIADHLRAEGVEGCIEVHCGPAYAGPDGATLHRSYKRSWVEHFQSQGAAVIYAGDGTSDIAAAMQAQGVFARDGLLSGLREGYAGVVRPFETLLDVATGLEEMVSEIG